MAPSRKLPVVFLVVVAAVHAAAAPVPAAPAPAQEYCGDVLAVAGVAECRSYVFGGAAMPSPACCAAYAAVNASDDESLCLCYVADGTFWRANGYGGGDDANVTGDSFLIPDICGQAGPPIEFWCEESGLELPPYGPQGSPAQPPASAGAGAPTAQPPTPAGTGVPTEQPPTSAGAGAPKTTQPPTSASAGATTAQPPTSAAGAATTAQPPSDHGVDVVSSIAKAKRGSSTELLMLLVAVAALCSIV